MSDQTKKYAHQLTPAYLIHPGEILLDELEARELNQTEFAKLIGMKNKSQLNELLRGKRDFSTELCILIANALDMSEQMWLNIKQNYETDKVRINERTTKKLANMNAIKTIKQNIPYAWLKKQGLFTGEIEDDVQKTKAIYNIDSIESLSNLVKEPRMAAYHRKSQKLDISIENLIAWENAVRYKADSIAVDTFDPSKQNEIEQKLISAINQNKNTIENCTQNLAEYGIKLLIQEKPPKCSVDGISFWSNDNPAIGLSMRYQRLDYLAFTLFHELGHIFLHLLDDKQKSYTDVDDNHSYGDSKEEHEANQYALDCFIPSEAWEEFEIKHLNYTDAEYLAFAEETNVHPSIVLGRHKHATQRYNLRSKIESKIY